MAKTMIYFLLTQRPQHKKPLINSKITIYALMTHQHIRFQQVSRCQHVIYFLKSLRLNLSFLVLDPRIKLSYYEDHGWEERYITNAKNLVIKVYKKRYAPPENSSISSHTRTFNDVQSHIFSIGKRRRMEKESEVEEYLKESIISEDIDVLLWWKVSLLLYRNFDFIY